jgi:hypothetical protein
MEGFLLQDAPARAWMPTRIQGAKLGGDCSHPERANVPYLYMKYKPKYP